MCYGDGVKRALRLKNVATVGVNNVVKNVGFNYSVLVGVKDGAVRILDGLHGG